LELRVWLRCKISWFSPQKWAPQCSQEICELLLHKIQMDSSEKIIFILLWQINMNLIIRCKHYCYKWDDKVDEQALSKMLRCAH
jgi:hypothetical protein